MNFWIYSDSAQTSGPSDAKAVSVVIKDFKFIPLNATYNTTSTYSDSSYSSSPSPSSSSSPSSTSVYELSQSTSSSSPATIDSSSSSDVIPTWLVSYYYANSCKRQGF